jgi:hypothetical protein
MYPDIPDHWAEGAHKEGDHYIPGPRPIRGIVLPDPWPADEPDIYTLADGEPIDLEDDVHQPPREDRGKEGAD